MNDNIKWICSAHTGYIEARMRILFYLNVIIISFNLVVWLLRHTIWHHVESIRMMDLKLYPYKMSAYCLPLLYFAYMQKFWLLINLACGILANSFVLSLVIWTVENDLAGCVATKISNIKDYAVGLELCVSL